MARSPHRREDLLAEATAMPVRGEFHGPGEADECVIGFRPSGAASIYFGEQPVLHFDADGRLRRMFYNDQQILAAGGRLQRRQRTGHGPRMEGSLEPLAAEFEDELLQQLSSRLSRALTAILGRSVQWGRTTVEVDELHGRVTEWSKLVGDTIRVGDL